ncbi:SPOR domain-containing protein [uncultured Marinobacter sp.]|uniref:SPOR domain-containing protein n=1 Tax=uncultured Marinobacter sp. TaxID=187379 RepID=UPI002620ECB2|nr:SPOR domain-containing protein [uncultured Marinobacter sp.]
MTAQFVAGFQEQTAINFLEQYEAVDELKYTRSTRQGQDWFVVFYGDFEDVEAARSALGELPADLPSRESWVRPLKGF